jgi:hypothetical protein
MGDAADDMREALDEVGIDEPRQRHGIRTSPTGRFIIGPNFLTQGQEAQAKDRIHRLTTRMPDGEDVQVYDLDVDGDGFMGGMSLKETARQVVGLDPAARPAGVSFFTLEDGLIVKLHGEMAQEELTFEQLYGFKPQSWPPSLNDWFRVNREKKEMALMSRDPATLRAQAMKMLEEAAFRESIPNEDPFDDGVVIKFSKKFVGSTVGVYHYAALKVVLEGRGGWYVTGAQQRNAVYDWPGLVNFIGVNGLSTAIVMEDGRSLIDIAKEHSKPAVEADKTLEDKVDKRPA